MKLSDYITQLKTLAAKYGIKKASYHSGYELWDHAFANDGLEPRVTFSIHPWDMPSHCKGSCFQGHGNTAEAALADTEQKLIAGGYELVAEPGTVLIEEPELA